MGMNSIAECIQRVRIRVKTGGHKVSEESILYNYEHGYANLYKYFKEFDTISLFDNCIANEDRSIIPRRMLYWENGLIKLYADWVVPDWVKKFVQLLY